MTDGLFDIPIRTHPNPKHHITQNNFVMLKLHGLSTLTVPNTSAPVMKASVPPQKPSQAPNPFHINNIKTGVLTATLEKDTTEALPIIIIKLEEMVQTRG